MSSQTSLPLSRFFTQDRSLAIKTWIIALIAAQVFSSKLQGLDNFLRDPNALRLNIAALNWNDTDKDTVKNHGVSILGIPNISELNLKSAYITNINGIDQIIAGIGDSYKPAGFFVREGYSCWVSKATIVKSENKVYLEVGVGMPSYIKDISGNEIRASGRMYADANSPGIHFNGLQLYIPFAIPIDDIRLNDIAFNYDQARGVIGGGAKIGFGKPTAVSYCPDFQPGPPTYGGYIELVNGQLNKLTIAASGMRYPLGTTLSFLDDVSAGINDIAPPVRNWHIAGAFKINCGCPIKIGTQFYPLTVDGSGKFYQSGYVRLDASAAIFKIPVAKAALDYNPPYNIDASMNVDLFQVYVSDNRIHFDSNGASGSSDGKLQVPPTIPLVGGWVFGGTKASWAIRSDYYCLSGSVYVNVTPEIPSVCTPEWCPGTVWMGCYPYGCGWSVCWENNYVTLPCVPQICTPRIPAVSVNVGFKFENGNLSVGSNYEYESPVASWETHYQGRIIDPETGARLVFFSNWHEIEKYTTDQGFYGSPTKASPKASRHLHAVAKGGTESTNLLFMIPPGNPEIIFRLAYKDSTVNTPVFEIKTPAGKTIRSGQGPLPRGYTNISGIRAFSSYNNDGRDVTVTLFDAEPGEYSVKVFNPNRLGEYSMQTLIENEVPIVGDVIVKPTATPNVYEISWQSSDERNQHNVIISINKDREGEDNYDVQEVFEDNGINSILIDLSKVDAHPGKYYVQVTVSDGVNQSITATSHETVTLVDPEAPIAVPEIAVRPTSDGFDIRWKSSPSTNVTSYAVLYTADEDTGHFEKVYTVNHSQNTASITGLKSGQPYLVTVVAHDDTTDLVSEHSEVVRVTPSPGFALTPPRITSVPDEDATIGHKWSYLPQVFDGDDIHYGAPNDPVKGSFHPGGNILWKLVQGPAGMSIHESGLLQWIPTSDQEGAHEIIIEAREKTDKTLPIELAKTLVDRQSFEIEVVIGENLSGVEPNGNLGFLFQPALTALAGQQYSCPIAVLGGDSTTKYMLLDGPSGMSVRSNRLEWLPAANARGAHVHVKATLSNNDEFEQEFYIDVIRKDNVLASKAQINSVRAVGKSIELQWRPSDPRPVSWPRAYQLQRQDSANGTWINIGDAIPVSPNSGHSDHAIPAYTALDAAPSAGSALYRMLSIE